MNNKKYKAIKFFGKNDLSIGYYLEKAEPIIKSFDPLKVYKDVNQVIELYNIQKLMETGVVLIKWDTQTQDELMSTCKLFNERIGRFFSSINDENIVNIVHSTDGIYIEDFWYLFSYYKAYQRVRPETMASLLTDNTVVLWPVIKQKSVVEHYDVELANVLRNSYETAELLIDTFLVDEGKKYYFPKSLESSEYETIFNAYIGSDKPNANYIKIIAWSQSSRECPISPKLRQKAKRRYEEELKKYINEQTGINYGVIVCFDDIDRFVQIEYENEMTPRYTYSSKWIEENLDYPTLLNNFLYLFGQVDYCWRSRLVSVESQFGLLERLAGKKGKKEYLTGTAYHVHDMISLSQIRCYRYILKKNGIDLEEIIRWFFEEYLRDEFQAEGFSFNISSDGTSYLEKCRNLAAEMDGVLKQYNMYLLDGHIDRDLFEISSEHIDFSDLPSFMSNKYAYANSEAIQQEMYLLFSDQSSLNYTEKTEEKYETVVEMLQEEKLALNDFAHYQEQSINWLIERGSIIKGNTGILSLNKDRIDLLDDLYEHDVICPNYYDSDEIINELNNEEELRYGASLFSEPEQSYLNYQLNQSQYSNGLDLRNKYIHSTYSQDNLKQQDDYDRLLRIMVLVVMKVNEEFCLRYPL